MPCSHVTLAWMAAMVLCSSAALAQSLPLFEIPRVEGLTIDGAGDDWPAEALTVPLLASPDGEVSPGAATLQLGWTEAGLVLRVAVRDATPAESAPGQGLHIGDSVEIFVRPAPGAIDLCQWLIAPGRTDEPGEPRMALSDRRGDAVAGGSPAPFDWAVQTTPEGYVVEARIGLECLNLAAEPGQELGLQVIVNDADGAGTRRQHLWHPFAGAYAMPWAYQRVRLAERASGPPAGVSYVRPDDAEAAIVVTADAALAGQSVRVSQEGAALGSATLSDTGKRFASARVALSPAPQGRMDQPLTVSLGEQTLAVLEPVPTPANHWELSIRRFEKADRESFPPPGRVLFIGSSSIGGWRTLEQDIPDVPTLRRGFGGSQISDSLHFVPRIVWPYNPSAVVLYAGGNDLGRKSPEQVFADFQAFVSAVHEKLPDTPVYFVALKPTVKTAARRPGEQAVNRMVADYAAATEGVGFIDLVPEMVDAAGEPLRQYLAADLHHPSAEGYALMGRIIGQRLIEDGFGSKE